MMDADTIRKKEKFERRKSRLSKRLADDDDKDGSPKEKEPLQGDNVRENNITAAEIEIRQDE